MKIKIISFLSVLFFVSCSKKQESTRVLQGEITESVYASGTIKSQDQYQVYSTANGILQQIYIAEGDEIKKNQLLFSLVNETSKLARENAQLQAKFVDFETNTSKLKELKMNNDFAKNKLASDSLNFIRQKSLYEKNATSKFQFEQSELNYQNSKLNYQSSLYRYTDLKKQLTFSDEQAKRNLQIAQKLESDFIIKSEINGKVYSILKEKGEMVNTQTPIAIIGNAQDFVIDLQVDEMDIVKIKKGQKVLISMDSYNDQTFEALVTKIYPYLNERSKTFTVEARFTQKPKVLYPNLSLEANIILIEKKDALIIPRKYLINKNYVQLIDGKKVKVKIGLIDFEKVEILSGISKNEELILPTE